jgi:hypothetical protein
VRSFIFHITRPQKSLCRSSQGEWGRRDMGYEWERREKCTQFWRERDFSEDRGVDGIRIDLGENVCGCKADRVSSG